MFTKLVAGAPLSRSPPCFPAPQATNEVSDSSYRAELESHLAGIRQTAEDLKAASAALHRGH